MDIWGKGGVADGQGLTADGHARDVYPRALVVGTQSVILDGGPLAVQYNHRFGRNCKEEKGS